MKRELIGTDETKCFGATVEVKAGDDAQPGEFEALAAVFGNVDLDGDRLVKGAFERTLQERGFPAVVWSHNRDVPPIGVVNEAKETNAGLLIKGRLFVDQHEIARQVYAAMKALGGDGRPALRDFSFGYRVRQARWVEEPDNPDAAKWGGEIREITDVDLWEVGPTLVGANPSAGVLGVKAATTEDLEDAATDDPDDGDGETAVDDADPGEPEAKDFTDRAHATRVAELLATPVPTTTTPSEE